MFSVPDVDRHRQHRGQPYVQWRGGVSWAGCTRGRTTSRTQDALGERPSNVRRHPDPVAVLAPRGPARCRTRGRVPRRSVDISCRSHHAVLLYVAEVLVAVVHPTGRVVPRTSGAARGLRTWPPPRGKPVQFAKLLASRGAGGRSRSPPRVDSAEPEEGPWHHTSGQHLISPRYVVILCK